MYGLKFHIFNNFNSWFLKEIDLKCGFKREKFDNYNPEFKERDNWNSSGLKSLLRDRIGKYKIYFTIEKRPQKRIEFFFSRAK